MANDILSSKSLNIIADIFSRHGREFVDTAKDNLKSSGAIASGDLYDSIAFNVEIMSQNVVLQISMQDYAEFVDQGRRAGKFPPINEIKQWIMDKSIVTRSNDMPSSDRSIQSQQNSLAYAIARKISLRGTRPTNFIPEFDLTEISQDMETQLRDQLTEDIFNELTKNLTINS